MNVSNKMLGVANAASLDAEDDQFSKFFQIIAPNTDLPVTWSYKKYKISEICDVVRGRSHFTKNYIKTNQGQYPVYSSQTSNDGEIGKINTYDHDGEFLTWTTDGVYAGTVFYRNGKFSLTSHAGLLEIKEPEIVDYKYLYYLLNKISHRFVNKTANQPMLSTEKMERIPVLLPNIQLQKLIGNFLFQLEEVFTNKTFGIDKEIELRKTQFDFYFHQLISFGQSYSLALAHNPLVKSQPEITRYKISELCNLVRGKGCFTKQYIQNHQGPYSVFSSQTQNFGEIGCIDTYDYDGEYLTWTTDGVYAGTLFHRNGKFSITSHAGLIEITQPDVISYKFLYFMLKSVINRYVNKTANQPMIGVDVIAEIAIPVPSLELQQQVIDILWPMHELLHNPEYNLDKNIELYQQLIEYYIEKLFNS